MRRVLAVAGFIVLSAYVAGCSATSTPNTIPIAARTASDAVDRAATRTRTNMTATTAPTPVAPAGFYDDFESDTVGSAAAKWTSQTGTWKVCQEAGKSREYCSTGSGDSVSL